METTFKNIADFKSALATNTDLQNEFKNDPVGAADKIHERPLDYDVWIYRIVVMALGLTVFTIIIGVLILMEAREKTDDASIPTILTAIGSAAIGALSGLLAPSPKNAK